MTRIKPIMNISIKITKGYNFSDNTLVIGNKKNILSLNEINEINRLLNLKQIKNKKQYFDKLLTSLNASKQDANRLINVKNKNIYLKYLKEEIEKSKNYITRYFFETLPLRLELFEKIITLENCKPTIYDHNTTTGRLKVIGGTNFLTMKSEDRNRLKHKDDKKIIQEIDFKSCEPNFYLKSKGIEFKGTDVYNFLMKKLNIECERSSFKRGVLSIIYGANEITVSKISKIPVKKIKEIKQIFDIDNFSNSLEKEYKEKGYIENYYGRPLFSKNNLVNHWIQSSAADYCCLAFREYLNKNTSIELHGVIHDAIIVSDYQKIDINTIKESISNIEIPVSIKSLGDN